MGMMETTIEIPVQHEQNVFGQFDAHAKKIERTLHVTLIARDENIKIMGEAVRVEKAKRVLTQLVELSKRGNIIQEQNVNYTLALVMEDSEESVVEIDKDIICHTLQGKPIKPKTLGQKKYVDAIRSQMITFGLGPAGTGKTYFAACIANALLEKEVPVRMTNLAYVMNCRYEERADLIKALCSYRLLILDDFGMVLAINDNHRNGGNNNGKEKKYQGLRSERL